MKRLILLVFYVLFFTSCKQRNEQPEDYRALMREFVVSIASYSRNFDHDFIVIPQNGEELVTYDGTAQGEPAENYINAISGLGVEDLFYGYDGDDLPTSDAIRSWIMGFLDVVKGYGKRVLVTDYCSTRVYVDSSYALSANAGYVSFAANHRELDAIPPYPALPYNVNQDSIGSLMGIRNFLYLINPERFSTLSEYVDTLCSRDYDLLIIDAFYHDSILNGDVLEQLRKKSNGARRLVIAYVSIGEAEDYRYYWKSEWLHQRPEWLCEENPNWPGNYAVKYWHPEWQSIIYGNDSSYLKKVINAGFDGVYLDKIDVYEYFEERGEE